jgi:hypothetical protein
MQAAFAHHPGASDRLLVIAVAAVDDRVAFGQQLGESTNRVLGGVARGKHHPDSARCLELPHQILERVRPPRAMAGRSLYRVGAPIECNDLVASLNQTGRHVCAHLPEPHHP